MANGINKVIILGTLGADPDMRFLPDGKPVCNVSIATNKRWKDKQTGEKKERVEWHRVVFYNRLGEIANEYLRKGSVIYVEGELRTRKWQDQGGVNHYTTEITAREMQMLGGGRSTQSPPVESQQQPQPSNSNEDFDDDVPF